MWDRELHAFGERLGLPGLALDDSGSVTLDFGTLGKLTITAQEDPARTFLFWLTQSFAPHESVRRFREALVGAHWREGLPYDLSVALLGDDRILGLRLDRERSTSADMENALRFLVDFAQSH